MKRMIFAHLAIALALGAALTVRAADKFDIKVYTAAEIDHPVTLDGQLTEDAWKKSPLAGDFTCYGKADTANPQTFFRIVYTKKMLYVGVLCDEPAMNLFMPMPQARDAKEIFHGETIEFFIDPTHSHGDYRQIAVNAAASIYDSRGQDPVWSARVKAAAHAGKKGWSLEIAIPWKDLGVVPKAGMILGFNVCRDRHIGEKQWTNWARVIGGFHDPIRFAHLVLSPSANQLGKLSGELRKGEREGRILIYSNKGVSGTSYRALAEHALRKLDQALADLRQTAAAEKSPAAGKELRKLLEKYTAEIQPIRKQLTANAALDARQWSRMDLEISKLRNGLENAVWDARLRALLQEL